MKNFVLIGLFLSLISCARNEHHLTKDKNLTNQDCEYMRNTAKEKGYDYDC